MRLELVLYLHVRMVSFFFFPFCLAEHNTVAFFHIQITSTQKEENLFLGGGWVKFYHYWRSDIFQLKPQTSTLLRLLDCSWAGTFSLCPDPTDLSLNNNMSLRYCFISFVLTMVNLSCFSYGKAATTELCYPMVMLLQQSCATPCKAATTAVLPQCKVATTELCYPNVKQLQQSCATPV